MNASPSDIRPAVAVQHASHHSNTRVDHSKTRVDHSNTRVDHSNTRMDRSSRPPQESDNTYKFLDLQDEWDKQSTNFAERTKWRARLTDDCGAEFVREFFRWMDENQDNSLQNFEKLSSAEFEIQLRKAHWKENNTALGIVNARLWRQYLSIEPEFRLGKYKGTPLSLRLHGRALGPQETEPEIREFHGITAVNPGPLFGIRYEASDESTEVRDFLFVPLGNVYFAQQQNSTKRPRWKDTGFILLLKILGSGVPDRLYVAYNFANQDHGREIEGNKKSELVPRFCNAEESFTLARMSPNIMDEGLQNLDREISLEPLCKLKPEIVETGVKGDFFEDYLPIPLFSPS